jgi:hypothetical protein
MTGNPKAKHISTSYVERQNLTMRMQMRRFTRLTNAFSKKVQNLGYAVALHFMHYNFCRVHQTLRVTHVHCVVPAGGLSDHNKQKLLPLSVDEFLCRFLLHVLPQGFVRIRHFGFLANRRRTTLLPLCF